MNPDDLDYDSVMRMITLGLAVHWTANQPEQAEDMTFADLFAIAERFGQYITDGVTGAEGH